MEVQLYEKRGPPPSAGHDTPGHLRLFWENTINTGAAMKEAEGLHFFPLSLIIMKGLHGCRNGMKQGKLSFPQDCHPAKGWRMAPPVYSPSDKAVNGYKDENRIVGQNELSVHFPDQP